MEDMREACKIGDVTNYFTPLSRDPLGSGSFGTVFKAKVLPAAYRDLPAFMPGGIAEHVDVVAIKTIDLGKFYCQYKWKYHNIIRHFMTEINALRKLHSPWTMDYYGCIYSEDTLELYIIMEFIDGFPLAWRIHPKRHMRLAVKNDILYKLALGIQYMHSKGIIHLDLKPANIMLGIGDAYVKIIDYGFSCVMDQMKCNNKNGTPHYMDPKNTTYTTNEEIKNMDWWAFGQIAWATYTGGEVNKSGAVGHVVTFKKVDRGVLEKAGVNTIIIDILEALIDPDNSYLERPSPDSIVAAFEQAVAADPPDA